MTTDCPREEDLAGYADGSIAGPAREALEAHFAQCGRCRAEARGILAALEPGAGVPAGLAVRVREGVRKKAGVPRRMEGKRMAIRMAVAAAILVGVGLWLAGPQPPRVQEKPRAPEKSAADLGGAERYLAHLSTDKPVYRPGEKVYARAVVLEAFSRKPLSRSAWCTFEVKSSRGESVLQAPSACEQGVAPFGWEIPQGQAGGVYTLVAKFPGEGAPPAEMTFDVRAYRVPRLRTDLQFLRKAFGPGDEVTAALSATRAEGGIPAGARVTAVATVDGAEVHRSTLALDAGGAASVTFRLPGEIRAGDGTLSMIIQDGGVQEAAAKTIPIVVNRVSLALFPEGGDLAAGAEGRVYFEARTPRQEPADVAGRILDDAGREVARFESVHEGRGRFSFKPAEGRRYRAVVDRPSGIKEPFDLPAVQASGFALAALDDRVPSAGPVRLRVTSAADTAATVGLFVREKELAQQEVQLAAGKPLDVTLAPKDPADGVLRVTLFDRDGKPRAERLVFRAPARALRIEVKVDPGKTVPAGKVGVSVRTTDESGKPVAAVVGFSAVDDAVLETIDKRERPPRLPVQALLGAEVKELKDAHIYLAGDALRADLLLGTQGWRRFAFVDPAKFAKAEGEAAKRALALREPAPPPPPPGAVFGALDRGGAPPPAPQRAEREDPKGQKAAAPLAAAEPRLEAPKPAPALPPPPPAAKPEPRAPAAAPAPEPPAFDQRVAGRRLLRADAPAWVRVYAHAAAHGRAEGQRTDFTETVYWHAGLATDEKGEASFSFHVSDSITTFRLKADGFTKEGALGEADGTVEVRRPFYTEPKFPLEVTAGDRIDLPISLVNGTDQALGVKLETSAGKGLALLEGASWQSEIAAQKSIRTLLPFRVEPHQGEVELRLRSQAGPHQDDVTRRISVVPAGFPIESNFGGVLEVVVRHEVAIPEGVVPSSLVTHAAVYPSPLASLTEALAALLREPYGCFEQTSSTNYPNVMALQYMQSHSGVDPALVRRALDLVEKGYKRLVSFECPKKGYEWFGHDPGHEALTSYGLMEFVDMSRVMNVDISMVERTRAWVLSRRDGKGGFLRDPKALDSFGGAPQEITDAYVLWALTESGETKGIEKEIAALREKAAKSEDPYLLALAANVLLNVGDRANAEAILARLAAKQDASGAIPGAKTSITRSGGESLEVETVSLAILGWLRSPKHTAHSEKAMRWLTQRCKSGRFGATQSTILALKAIVAYDAAHARPKRAGKVILAVDGRAVREVPFPAEQQGPILIGDFSESLAPGKRQIELRMEGGADMPYSLQVKYHARTPASAEKCKVSIKTALSRAEAGEGEPVDVAVEVGNRAAEGLPMVTAIVGLPGGLEARADQLKELVRAGRVDAFETRGREVILYWRSMAPGARHALVLSCLAAVPGEYTGPASRAYLYYTDEEKDWQPGLGVKVVRR